MNEKHGEFQYTIEGKGELPEHKVIDLKCSAEDMFEFNLDIDQQNKLLLDALSNLKVEHFAENKTSKKRLGLNNDRVTFNVESTKSFFIVPNQFSVIIDSRDTKQLDMKHREMNHSNLSSLNNNSNRANQLLVKFTSKLCQLFEGDILLRNVENVNDIRIYRVKITVVPKNIKATLEFTCPVNEKIIQKIPIFNNSDKDWIVKADLMQDTRN